MPIARSQAQRLARVDTGLGADKVFLERFTYHAHLSEPFLMLVDVVAERPTDFTNALYKPVLIATSPELGAQRQFNGLLFGVERREDSQDGAHYQLAVRPWLAALTERVDIRIFQEMSAVDIIKKVFQTAGFADFKVKLQGQHPVREYCVQYRESDFAFVSRLMEDEGICYFFEHDAGRHVLVLADNPAAHIAAKGLPSLEFQPPGSERSKRKVNAWRWDERLSTASAKQELSEYAFLTPGQKNKGAEAASPAGPHYEVYDHPSGFGALAEAAIQGGAMPGESKRLAKLRLEALRAEVKQYQCETDALALNAGDKVTLKKHPQPALNIDYLVVAITHAFTAQHYRSGGGGDEFSAEASIECIPYSQPWRPRLKTPKPVTAGPQTARVVGPLVDPKPTEDSIFVDKHGRVKIQFHWDREGKNDPKSSCWMRVSQGWADGGFGAMFLPRIGQEVIVDFLDGDPDRPIITGRVFNAAKMPPYPLPARKTVSTLKTRSVGKIGPYPEAEEAPGANDIGFNELRFDDAGGKEELYIHAQRDMNSWVRFDEHKKVGRDRAFRVGRNQETHVKKNETFIVETGDEKREVSKGSRDTKIQKDDVLKVAMGNLKQTIDTGNFSMKVSKGKAKIEAMQSIELKVGTSTLKLTPTAIVLKAMTITIDAKMTLAAKAGLTSELKGGVMVNINGAMVMIN